MKNRGTIILAGLTALAVGYVVFDFQYEKHTDQKKADAALLLKLDKDQISEFEIERFGPNGISQKISAKRNADGWQLQTPLEDLMDQGATSDFVEASTLERSQQVIKEGDGIDWKVYGLDQPKGKVTYKTNAGQSQTIEVSTQKNFMADVYIRKTGENKVYLASSTWTARVDKQPYDFRDKRIMRNPYSAIDQAKLKLVKESYTLHKVEGKWKSKEKPEWNLDQSKAGELSSMLSTTNIMEFAKEGEPSKDDLKKIGIKEQRAEIQIQLNNGKSWSATFYQNEKKEYYLQTSDPKRLVRIAIPDGDKIATKTLASLRDGHEPFDFKKDQAKKLVVYKDDGKKEEFTSEKADHVIRSLRNLEVKSFDAPAATNQLKDFIEVLDQENKPLFKMSTFRVGNQIAVKTNLYSQVIGLEDSQIKNLGLEKLFEKEPETQKETEVKTENK